MVMATDKSAIPTIEPMPNNKIKNNPCKGDVPISVVNNIIAAEPAIPCINPTKSAWKGNFFECWWLCFNSLCCDSFSPLCECAWKCISPSLCWCVWKCILSLTTLLRTSAPKITSITPTAISRRDARCSGITVSMNITIEPNKKSVMVWPIPHTAPCFIV